MLFNSRQLILLGVTLLLGVVLTWRLLPSTQIFSVVSGQEAGGVDLSKDIPRKPGEPEGFSPTPFPDVPLQPDVPTVEPGQPVMTKPRPSQEELAKLAIPSPIPPEMPSQNHVIYDVMPVNSKSAAFQSDTIVIANVQQIHPAQWSTEDGKRPQNPHDNNNPFFIFTLVDIKVEQVLRGEVSTGDVLTLMQNGGQIGEDRLTVESPYPQFIKGEAILLYLNSWDTSQLPIKLWQMPAKIWTVREQYWVELSTRVATNPFGQRSVDELITEIEEVKQLKPNDLQQVP